jgi:hypothetical protein
MPVLFSFVQLCSALFRIKNFLEETGLATLRLRAFALIPNQDRTESGTKSN